MRCERVRRWISDELDGELAAKKTLRLAAHLQGCPSCRTYQKKLQELEREMAGLTTPSPPAAYWEHFSARLRARLLAEGGEVERQERPWRGWRLAWAGAAAVLVVSLGLTFFLFLRPRQGPGESLIFSYESFLNRVYQEIGVDDRLTDPFNLTILDFLVGGREEELSGLRLYFPEDPLFVESLSDEEVEFINREIELEMKTKGG